jgi:PAS domain-containing protein
LDTVNVVWLASALYLLSAAISAAAAGAVLNRGQARGAYPLAGMLIAAAIWAACDAVEVQLGSVSGRRLISQVQYFGVVSAAPFFTEAALQLARADAWLQRRWVRVAIWAVPILTIGVAWTSAWHDWLWTAIHMPTEADPFATYDYGWWFWVLTAQHYVLMGVGATALILATSRVSRAYRTPMLGVILAVAVAWLGNAIYVFKLGPVPGLNWLTLSLGFSGSVMAWMVVNEGLLDLMPRAREALLHTMTDAVVILDGANRLIFANEPAAIMLDLPDGAQVLPPAVRLPDLQRSSAPWLSEVALDHASGGRRWLDLRVDPIVDRWGDPAGRLVVARDITMRKVLESERERLIVELKGARGTVKELQQLLPVCASCHKVRDETGGWSELSRYLQQRAVEVSHGICPDCYQRLYGVLPG